LPGLQAVADELAPRGVQMITVMMEGSPAAGKRFVEREGLHVPVVVGEWGLLKAFHVDAYPWTLIFDGAGKPVYAIRGGRDRDDFKRILSRFTRSGT
jgi:hypothetical protein